MPLLLLSVREPAALSPVGPIRPRDGPRTAISQRVVRVLSGIRTKHHPQLASSDDDAAGPSAEKRAQSGGVNIKATLFSAVAAACNTSMDALSAALAPGGKSILQVCQATNPSVTLDSLATAVTAAIKAQLAAAVSAGQMTTAQESTMLAKLGQGIDTWLTTPISKQGD